MPPTSFAAHRPLLFLLSVGALASAACGIAGEGTAPEADPALTDSPTFDPIVDEEANDDGQGHTRERIDRLIGGSNLSPPTDVTAGTRVAQNPARADL